LQRRRRLSENPVGKSELQEVIESGEDWIGISDDDLAEG